VIIKDPAINSLAKGGRRARTKQSIKFPSLIKLKEHYVWFTDKKFSLGVEFPLSKSINFSSLMMESYVNQTKTPGLAESLGRSSFELDSAGFFLTEDPGLQDISGRVAKINKSLANDSANQMTALITENDPSVGDSKVDELHRNILSEMKETLFNPDEFGNELITSKAASLSYDDFKRCALKLIGQKKEYDHYPIKNNIKSVYYALKQTLKTVELVDFKDLGNPGKKRGKKFTNRKYKVI
jgi:hypothetical protein